MARVIGLGIQESNADKALTNRADFVGYRGLDRLEDRVFATRRQRTKGLFTPFEVVSIPEVLLSEKKLPEMLPEIAIREQEGFKEARAYDIALSCGKPVMNFTTALLEFAPCKADAAGSVAALEKIIQSNCACLAGRTGADRLALSLPILPKKAKGKLLPLAAFLRIARGAGLPLSVDLDDLTLYAKASKINLAKALELVLENPIVAIKIEEAYLEESLTWVCDNLRNGRLNALRAILYKGANEASLTRIGERLRKAGATLIADALSADYYFAEWKSFKHTGIFNNTQYVYHALNNIHNYTTEWVLNKMKSLDAKIASFQGGNSAARSGAVIEPGAKVHPDAKIGLGVVIKSGACVEAGTVIEAGATIGDKVYISTGAKVLGGILKDNVFVGKNVVIEGAATVIKNNVYLDDNVKLVRNSVVENRVYANEGCLIDGATLGNSVILEKDCQILPGGYIRKDTIFGLGVVFRSEAKNTVVMDAEKVFDSALGKHVYAGSESGHYGYLGDSILGKLVNEGAGDKNSNVKNDWGEVNADIDGWKFRSGLCKFGAIIGDYTTVGCLTVLEPASLIGKACNVYGAKYRGFLQTASVFAEEQKGRQRFALAIPRPEGALEGRSEPALKVIEQFEKSGTKRIGE